MHFIARLNERTNSISGSDPAVTQTQLCKSKNVQNFAHIRCFPTPIPLNAETALPLNISVLFLQYPEV